MNGRRTNTPGLAMNQVVQDVPERAGALKTGFPEPLSPVSNTTLPHPSADTSPNACIEASDVPLSRTHSRVSSRHSFRFHSSSKNKASRADGPIDMAAYTVPVGDGNGRTSHESIDGVLDARTSVETRPDGEVVGGDAGGGQVVSSTENWEGELRTSSEASLEKDKAILRTPPGGTKGGVLRKLHLGKS